MASIIAELNRLQERQGWLPEAELRRLAASLSVPLHRLESVSTFYTHYRRSPPAPHAVEVCRDLSCAMARGESACARLRERLGGRADVELSEVSCIGRCDRAPAGFVDGVPMAMDDAEAVIGALESGAPGDEVDRAREEAREWAADIYASAGDRHGTSRRLLGGEISAATAIAALEEAGLRGMGGAGFPTGLKWKLVSREPARPKHVICNADESEPGTFKDREILRNLPHLVIEGMVLAGFAVGAERGTVFIRHEYERERTALESSLDAARAAGALGDDIHGTGFDFDIEVFVSPGGYILGEESALLECMEDRRGEPRNKPPFPGQRGLHGMPTLINNVETFAHAVGIIGRGVDWWKNLGEGEHAGHKFISVSGDVERPGVHLVPLGSTLRELLARCGGVKNGAELLAVAPGGASSNFLPASCLDSPIDFDDLARAGSMLGSGAAVFVAEGRNLLELGLNVTRFFRNESCGKCVPCRVGSEKAVRLVAGTKSVDAQLDATLGELHETLAQTSICGLGQVALGPLRSIIENFPERVCAPE